MKLKAIPLLIFTTLLLVLVTIFSTMKMPFQWVFYLMVFGQAIFVFTVYKVLTDLYTTDKTFEDFYEDNPIGNQEKKLMQND